MLLLRWDHWPIYKQLMRADRPIGTWLVLWPTLWALWLAADGIPPLHLLAVFTAGAFLMRSAGCVINDYADRDFDPQVARTRNRPLAQRAIQAKEALQLFVALCLLAACLLFFTNALTFMLSIGAVAIAALYPFMKRYTHLPQVILGMAFSWSIPMVYAAVQNQVPAEVWLIYLAVTCWVVAYDTFYAMVDRDDDLKAGIKSTAILFGHRDRQITLLLQVSFVSLMLLVGQQTNLGAAYFISVLAAILLLGYQQMLIAKRDKDNCFKAFLNNHYVGMVLFIGIAVDYLLQ